MWEGRVPGSEQMVDDSAGNSQLSSNNFAPDWFRSRLCEARSEVHSLMQQFRLSEALKTIYSLIWDDFCSWYLEWIKPGFEQPIDAAVYKKTIEFFTELMQLLHPYMPFVTEEIYHLLQDRDDDLCVKQFEQIGAIDSGILSEAVLLKEVITGIRDIKNKQQIKPKETIVLHIQTENRKVYEDIQPILAKQVNAASVSFTNEPVVGTITTVIGKDKFYIETEQPLNTGQQKDDLLKELNHLKGFLVSVEKKLGNEKFVQNAKAEVLALEQKKKADAEMKIRVIEESLAGL
jgi:valyl-tRNA synthetase